MPMSYKSSSSSAVLSDPSPRNPRVHRQTGIPSVSRPRLSPNTSSGPSQGTLGTLKKTAHHLLSKTPDASEQHTPSTTQRRFASMPHPQAFTTVHRDANEGMRDHNAGVASPPIVDFTTFEDTYRGPRSGNYEGLMARRSRANTLRNASDSFTRPALKRPPTPSAGASAKPIPATGVPLPASARKPDPRLIISSLENVFGDAQSVDEYLDAHELLAVHQLDQVDFEDRERVRKDLLRGGKLEVPGQKGALAVLGEPIRKASIYASTSMVLAGREHELPIIVVNTVEELYRTGIYQPNLFRALPNRARLLELIDIYDSATQHQGSVIRARRPSSTSASASSKPQPIPQAGFGSHTSLHLESTPDICALLTTYLSSLPEPILPPPLFGALWEWCGLDEEDTYSDVGAVGEKLLRQDSFGPRISHIPLARTYTSPEESTRIVIAQLVLHLLPSAQFSLLVYLLAFFSQAALVQEENGVGVADLARMFGGRIFGDGSISEGAEVGGVIGQGDGKRDAVFDTSQTRRTGETMMSWFLRRWGPLSEGLFDVVDDAKMGIFHRTVARRDSLGKDVLHRPLSLTSSSGSGSGESAMTLPSPEFGLGKEWVTSQPRGRDIETEERTPVPRIHLDGVPLHSTPKASGKGRYKEDDLFETECVADGEFVVLPPTSACVPDETLDITQLPSRICEDVARASSTATYERLMDISLPTLLNQTLFTSKLPSIPIPTPQRSHHKSPRPHKLPKHTEREVQTMRVTPEELVHALQLTAHLEAQLEERTNALTEALKDLARAKLGAARLQERVRELEMEMNRRRRAEEDGEGGYHKRLEATRKERDDAQELVSEIKRLVRRDEVVIRASTFEPDGGLIALDGTH